MQAFEFRNFEGFMVKLMKMNVGSGRVESILFLGLGSEFSHRFKFQTFAKDFNDFLSLILMAKPWFQ